MPQTWYLDSSDLIYRIRAGLPTGYQSGQPVPPSSYRFLEDLLSNGHRLVTNSLILEELTQGGHADGLLVRDWLLQNSSQIQIHQLTQQQTEHYRTLSNGGERSLIDLTSQHPDYIAPIEQQRFVSGEDFSRKEFFTEKGFSETNYRPPAGTYGDGYLRTGSDADFGRGADFVRSARLAGIGDPALFGRSNLPGPGDIYRSLPIDEAGRLTLPEFQGRAFGDLSEYVRTNMFRLAGEAVGVGAILLDSWGTRQAFADALARGDLAIADELLGGLIGRSFGGAFASALLGAQGGAIAGLPGMILGAIIGGIVGAIGGGEIGEWLFGRLNDLGFSAAGLLDDLADLLREILSDPLVLDLDGDGIELTSLTASATRFDLDDDGLAERTGWVGSHDGMLVDDANGNGIVDGLSELFGSANVDGYDELKTLDSNNDGRIDINDPAYARLRVWRDVNQDGVSTPEEMLTLAQAGIAHFNLGYTESNSEIDGNVVARSGSYVRTDGSSRTMASVQFALDQSTGRQAVPEGTDLGEIMVLPNLGGAGSAADLRTAMFFDAGLRAMVEDLATGQRNFATFQDFVEGGFLDVLHRWAGVDTSVPPTAEAPYHLQVLEALTGVPLEISNEHQRERLEETWKAVLQELGVKFLIQAANNVRYTPIYELSQVLAGLNPGSPTFLDDVASLTSTALSTAESASLPYGYLAPFSALRLDPGTGEILGDFDAFVAQWLEDQPSFFFASSGGGGGGGGGGGPTMGGTADPVESPHPWSAWYSAQGSLLLALAGAMGIGRDYVLNATGWRWLGQDVPELHGTSAGEVLEDIFVDRRIFGYDGDDELRGRDGVDSLIGGAGNDLLKGGSGSDMYVYAGGDGLDRIIDESGNEDVIYFSSELRVENLRITRIQGTNDIHLHFGDSSSGIILANQWESSAAAIEQFHFVAQDGLNSGDIASIYLASFTTAGVDTITGSWADEVIFGKEGNDTLAGLGGDDRIDGGDGDDSINGGDGQDVLTGGDGQDTIDGGNGSDVLIGGVGNDYLRGGAQADTYTYNISDGDDVIFDYGHTDWTVTDTLAFGAGITPESLVISRVAEDWNKIRISFVGHSGSILIEGQQWNDAGIEQVMFADGTIWNHAQFMARYVSDQQTSGDDIIHGSTLADVVEGGAGNDRAETRGGDDVLIGGAGNDRLEGGGGSDTYVYNLGDGDDAIFDYADGDGSETDILSFGAGITSTSLLFSRVASDWNAIIVSFAGQGGSIRIDGQQWGDAGIEQVVFADGTIWNHAQFMAAYISGQQTSGDDIIHGSTLADMVEGGAGNDRAETRGGDDVLIGGEGNDDLQGGAGADTYIYNHGDGDDTIFDYGNTDGSVTDVLSFGAGITAADLIFTTRTGDVHDVRISFRDFDGSIILDGQGWGDAGVELIRFADGSTLTQAQFTALIKAASDSSSQVTGTTSNDSLWTVDGDDHVNGMAGDDIIGGGAGNDILYGDTTALRIPTGVNLIINGSFETSGTIVSSGSWGRANSTLPGWTRTNSQNFEQVSSGYGGVGATNGSYWLDLDSAGGAGSNMLISQEVTGLAVGATYLLQFDHANRTSAASGGLEVWWNGACILTVSETGKVMQTKSLELIAGGGSNVVEFRGIGAADNAGASLDNVRLFALAPPAASEFGNDSLYGGGGDDTIYGMAGNDLLHGGAGADRLLGGAGADVLTGGSGADRFDFAYGDLPQIGAANHDRITDFSSAEGDLIDLSAIDAVAGGSDDSFSFICDGAFSGTAGELRYRIVGDDTIIEGDLDGDGSADLMIVLTGSVLLFASDFVL